MHKKPGQISSNTLSLRFMQNAAKARQEREVEAAKAKVKNEEEWELAPDLRESWGAEDRPTDDQRVSYEQSYLPFLFPALSDSGIGSLSSTSNNPDTEEEGEEASDLPTGGLKGRRKFGKHGKEETEEKTSSETAPPQGAQTTASSLPRGARSISSHGRTAASTSKISKGLSHRPTSTSAPSSDHITHTPSSAATQGFMKPPIDAPRIREDSNAGKKRRSHDAEADRRYETNGPSDGARKKKRKE